MHFCADELMALLAAIPFLGVMARRLHAWWHARRCPHAPPAPAPSDPPEKWNPDPVRYFTQDYVNEYNRPQNPGGALGPIEGPGWYFYDETWAFCYGPYPSEASARAALNQYVETL